MDRNSMTYFNTINCTNDSFSMIMVSMMDVLITLKKQEK
jgi:hypothetical protein